MLGLATFTHWTLQTRVGCAQTGNALGFFRGHAEAIAPDNADGLHCTLTLHERAEWIESSPGFPPVGTQTRNTWQIVRTPSDESLVVQHLRLGKPVTLVTLAPSPTAAQPKTTHGMWSSTTPNPCGDDQYALTATHETHESAKAGSPTVTLHWTVHGPHKAHALVTTYRPAE